jgi:formylglycine-generating enzyme required for sulfatase activity
MNSNTKIETQQSKLKKMKLIIFGQILLLSVIVYKVNAQGDAAKIAEARYALEQVQDCSTALHALSDVSENGRRSQLFIYYYAKVNDCLSRYDTAVLYYNLYLDFVPYDTSVLKQIAKVSYELRKKNTEKEVVRQRLSEKLAIEKEANEKFEKNRESLGIEKNMVYIQKEGGKSFYISKYEVTQELWKRMMTYNPSKHGNCDDCPVEQVTWKDVQEFLRNLNLLSGGNYRLPTEEEWEYAALGGNKSHSFTYSGSNNIDDVGWYAANCGAKTHEVGHKNANELGLYDMTGNVSELCSDWYDNTKQYHTVRGASYYNTRLVGNIDIVHFREPRGNNGFKDTGLRIARD